MMRTYLLFAWLMVGAGGLALGGCTSLSNQPASTPALNNCGTSDLLIANLASPRGKRLYLLPDHSPCQLEHLE